MATLESFVELYLMMGVLAMGAALIYDRPKLSWKWLLLPACVVLWPYFVHKAIKGYR